MLPASARVRYREQWLADLRDAAELEVQRGGIVFGAFSFATVAVSRDLLGTELRASRTWVQPIIIVLLFAIPLYGGLVQHDLVRLFGTAGWDLRGNFDVFSMFMSSPLLYLLFPLYAVFLSCLRLYRELGHRFASNTRSRVRLESYIFAKLLVAGGTSFVVFFCLTFSLFVLAFYVWPIIGNPSIEPSGYHLTAATAIADSFSASTYSQLLELGPMAFGVLYSLWVGFCASVWSGLGMAALLIVKNRPVALALPFVIYFAQTVVMQLLGDSRGSFVASTFPFGLDQTTILAGVTPTLILATIVAVVWIGLLRRLPLVDGLS
jgi:MFS family permease